MDYLELKNISKSFYGVQVLKDVSLTIKRGEVHGLIGENGAGKSTLMNIVSGLLTKDTGEIIIEKEKCTFSHPVEAEKKGIIHIHQELNIFPELSIVENIFLGKEINQYGFLQKEKMNSKAKEILSKLSQKLDVSAKAGDLSVGYQQMIEVAKSLLHHQVQLVILDEPTASLTNYEIEKLFDIINFLKEKEAVSFIYVSHRMEELFRICDRLTVLRDGEYICTKTVTETNLEEIITMMVGRKVDQQYGIPYYLSEDIYSKQPVLKVKNISKDKKFKDVTFNLYSGEILGFYGLVGAGRTDVMNTVFGVTSKDTGEIYLHDTSINNTPNKSIKMGVGFLPENRKIEGLLSNFDIQENISISNLKKMVNFGIINKRKEYGISKNLITKLSIKVASLYNSILSLSGGNQQKTLFARCLNYPLKVFILDEPTRGVDVGSKRDIYEIIKNLARTGVGIIFVSSDLPEILGISNRVAVMHEGKLMGILNRKDVDTETIIRLSTNTHETIKC